MKSEIHPTAIIHPTAWINPENVIIEENVIIGPQTCVGTQGPVTRKEFLIAGKRRRLPSKGILVIKKNADIGPLNNLQLGHEIGSETIMGENLITGSNNGIGHDVQTGKNVQIIGLVAIAGYVKIEDDVRIGPGSVIRERLTIGKGARISMGSIVTRDVLPGQTVTGNFAIDHELFIKNLKSIVKK